MNETRVLNVDRLSIRFGEAIVLHDVSFAVEQGSALAIVGPNASGKTVLFRALIGAIRHDGTVTWAEGSRIGYVPQRLDLERDLPITGLDFLGARAALTFRAFNRSTRHERRAAVLGALELVGMGQTAASQPIGTLSGGQFQRLLVAFALVGRPNVLLLDEPTAGVDEPGQERLNELVRRLREKERLTVLFISHDLTIVDRFATNVLHLDGERVQLRPSKVLAPVPAGVL